jgi:adenylate kinase family enzyme
MTPIPLAELGPRICIFGPSNAGKSTLANAIGRKLGAPAIYLDQLHHQPDTNWVVRSREEVVALHSAAIATERWVMEGNYMGLLKDRAMRATGVVLLGTDRWTALGRYIRRTLFEGERLGMLAGAENKLSGEMVRFILIEQPRKRQRDVELLRATGLPMIQLESMGELRGLYDAWGLVQARFDVNPSA